MIRDLKDKEKGIIKKTNIHKEAFVAESADVVGDVTIGKGTSMWYGSVARGDMASITIGEYSNVQDNATVHVDTDMPTRIGDYTTVGHNAIIHGCTIGNNCLIGMGAIILNGAVVGDNSIVAAGSLVTEGANIPSNSLVMGSPGKVRRQVSNEDIENIRNNAIRYEKLWRNEHIE